MSLPPKKVIHETSPGVSKAEGSADGEGISFFFLRGMFGEGEDSPSFLFMKPTI